MKINKDLLNDNYIDKWEQTAGEIQRECGFDWLFDAGGRHYMNLNPLVMSTEMDAKFKDAFNGVVNLLHFVRDAISKAPQFMDFLGIPENLKIYCNQLVFNAITSMGRFDWMYDINGNIRLLELNAETPFGFVEAVHVQDKIHETYFSELSNPNSDLLKKLRSSLQSSLKLQGGSSDSTLAFVGFLDDHEEQISMEAIAKIADYPCNTVFADIRKLQMIEDEVYFEGKKIDFLHTAYSVEWYAEDRDGEQFIESLRKGKIKLINPPQTLLMHSKALFAILWLLKDHMNKEQQIALEKYIPYCCFSAEGIKAPLMKKPLHHREGRGIQFIADKADLINEDGFIYQEYIKSFEFEYPIIYNGRVRPETLKPTIGTFIASDEFCGYYTRFGGEIVNGSKVSFSPTFVE